MPSPFVTTRGTRFELNGSPFQVSGVNCYFLAYCSDETRRTAMAAAKRINSTVVRSWAFQPLTDAPNSLLRLDHLIKVAEDTGIRLILPLTNYWEDFGGMRTYLKPNSDVTDFYRLPEIRAAYREWVNTVLSRQNTITGRLYLDEPSIMAWELTNEARCQTLGGRELLLEWIGEMSEYVKRLDSNHLLALGDEGFFYKKGRGHLYDGTHGVDWEAILALQYMDFGTYHFYPQDWGYSNDFRLAKRWIRDHSRIAHRLNKPVILEEYGLKGVMDRNIWYQRWRSFMRDSGTAGDLVWMLGCRSSDAVGYVDDYVIYEGAEPAAANPAEAGP